MRRHTGERLRLLGIAVVFIVGTFAIAATSAASTTIQVPKQTATFQLDPAHPAAVTRIVIALNAEATSAYGHDSAQLTIAAVRPASGSGAPYSAAEQVRFIVASVEPGAAASIESTGASLGLPGPTPFEAEATLGLNPLPLACGIGPCERAFWLIAQLTDPAAEPIQVDWEVSAAITYGSETWPSGAGGSITLESTQLVAGPVPNLVVSSESEAITLGPRQPAAARVVEVGIGANAINGGGGAVLSVDMLRRSSGSGGTYDERAPIVRIYPLEGAEGDGATAPLPTGIAAPDPFLDCAPGSDCTRRFLVTLEWAGDDGAAATYDWSVTVRRTDVVRAWSTPAALTASVERRFDIDPSATPEQKVHLEGRSVANGPGGAAQVQVELGATTTAADVIARLLPAPAVMTYRARSLVGDPAASPPVQPAYANMSMPGGGGGMPTISLGIGPNQGTIVANPLAGCSVGGRCNPLEINTVAQFTGSGSSVPDVPFEWSLDVALFSFREAPLTLTSVDLSPPGH